MSGNTSKKEKIKKICDSMYSRPFTSIMIYNGIMDEMSKHGRKRKCVPTISQVEQCMSRLESIEKIGKYNGMIQYRNKNTVDENDQ